MTLTHRMAASARQWIVPAAATLGLLASGSALGLDSVKILVPAAPGGGWDQTGRVAASGHAETQHRQESYGR